MTKAKRLTVAGIDRIKPPASGRAEHFDNVVPGLALRVTEKGKKSWTFLYRIDGRQRRLTFGPYPAIALDEARGRARDARLQVERGEDPAYALSDQRAEAARSRQTTFAKVAERFLGTYRRGKNAPQTVAQSESLLRRHVLPRWANTPISALTRQDVMALLDDVTDDRRPFMAVNLHKDLRTLFNWAVERELIEVSPVGRYSVPVRQTSRDRVLTDAEVAAVWHACDELGYPFGSLVQFLMLTAQRRSEAAKATWVDIDFDAATWTIPRELSKSDRTHNVPLAPQVVELLTSLPRFASPHVFTTTGGRRPVSGFSKAKKQVDELSSVTGWRLHDLRRTAASGMARLGTPPQVLARLLNHAPARLEGVTAVYNRWGYEDEKRQALEAWADHLQAKVL